MNFWYYSAEDALSKKLLLILYIVSLINLIDLIMSAMLCRFWNLATQYNIKLVFVLSCNHFLFIESWKPEMSHTS